MYYDFFFHNQNEDINAQMPVYFVKTKNVTKEIIRIHIFSYEEMRSACSNIVESKF